MTTTRKPTGRARSMPAGLAIGALTSLGITLAAAIITAKIVDTGAAKEGNIGYFAMGILLISSYLGSIAAAMSIKHQKLMVCGISGGIYYGMLLGMTALFFGGQYQGMGVTALLVLCGAAIAALTVTGQGRGTKGTKHRKRVHR